MPELKELGHLLAADGPALIAAAPDLPQLDQPVGQTAYTPADLTLQAASAPLSLLGRTVRLSAGTTVQTAIRKAGEAAPAFAPGETIAAPAGTSWTEIELDGQLADAAEMAPAAALLQLSLASGGDGALTYRRLVPAAAAVKRADALRGLVAGTRLLSALDPAALAAGEVHEMVATLHLSLAAAGVAGESPDTLASDLMGGLAPALQAHWGAVLQASLGVALYEPVRISVGRAGTLTPGRLRLRCARLAERRLTLAALLELEVRYDLAPALEGLLAHALDLLPSRAVHSLRELLRVVSDGGWSAVKTRLGGGATATIGELLGDAAWSDHPTDAAQMAQLLLEAQALVRAYDSLDDRLKSLWDRLLGRIGFAAGSPLYALLGRLAALDPAHPAALFAGAGADLLPAVEILSGRSAEQLLLGGAPERAALAALRELASRGLASLNVLPQSVRDRLAAFAGSTGVAGTVAWLTAHATSVERLRDLAGPRLRRLVERLLGKPTAAIEAADLPPLRGWLERVGAALAHPAAIEADLARRLDRLRGEAGFSCGLEVDRVSRTTALLDLELALGDAAAARAARLALSGALREALATLPEGGGAGDDAPAALPYLLRESVFTSSRLRSDALAAFVPLLGWSQGSRRRLVESSVRLTGGQDGAAGVCREAAYAGTFQASEAVGPTVLTAAVGLSIAAAGAGTDLAAAYAAATPELRLTVVREGGPTGKDELAAIGFLLRHLGFDTAGAGTPDALAPGGRPTRLAIDLRLPEAAVTALTAGISAPGAPAAWALDYLNAAHRWLDERLVPGVVAGSPVRRGAAYAALLAEAGFRTAWGVSEDAMGEWLGQRQPLHVTVDDGASVALSVVQRASTGYRWREGQALASTFVHGRWGFQALGQLQAGGAAATPAALGRRSELFARFLASAAPRYFASPLFLVWLTVSRLSRLAPDALRAARGFASLRSTDDAGIWGRPQLWPLLPERLVHPRGTGLGIFPLV